MMCNYQGIMVYNGWRSHSLELRCREELQPYKFTWHSLLGVPINTPLFSTGGLYAARRTLLDANKITMLK